MEFKHYFFSLPRPEQESLAQRAGTSHQMLAQIARGNKQIELGFADVIVAMADGALTLEDLPLTERAEFQSKARAQTNHVTQGA